MDLSNEVWKFRLLMTAIVFFFVALFMSWTECKYYIWGKNAVATLGQHHTEQNSNGQKYQVVEYTYQDGDETRRGYVNTSIDDAVDNIAAVKIQYIPGRDRASRLINDTHPGWIWVFGICILFLIAMGIWVYREAHYT